MKLFCLDVGFVHGGRHIFFEDASKGDYIVFPVSVFLIETDDRRNILFDCGVYPGGILADSASYRYQTQDQTLENQLKLCGRLLSDIDTVVLSHMHYDHCGYLFKFTDKEIIVNEKEYEYAFTHPGGAYSSHDYDVGITNWRFVNDDREIAPGVKIIQLPGHSIGHMGMIVSLEHQNYLLPQDALYAAENDFPDLVIPGIMYDKEAYMSSLFKIRELRSEDPNLITFYGHDKDQGKKTVPDFYY